MSDSASDASRASEAFEDPEDSEDSGARVKRVKIVNNPKRKLDEQLRMLDQHHEKLTRSQVGILRALIADLRNAYINGRQITADQIEKIKKYMRELGRQTTEELEKLKTDYEEWSKILGTASEHIAKHHYALNDHKIMIQKLERAIQTLVCDIRKIITEYNQQVETSKLKVSLLEKDIDALREENAELKKQNVAFNERLNVLEAKLQST